MPPRRFRRTLSAALGLTVAAVMITAGSVAGSAAEPRSIRSHGRPSVLVSWLHLVDRHRWTVSHGHVLAKDRRLRTILLRPSSPGRHPLVVFCHGYDSNPLPYLPLLKFWAARGFIVAAPYFPLTRKGAGRWLDENDVAKQPGDVSFVITRVLHVLRGEVQPDHIIVAGHSDGGSTAFMVGFQRNDADPRVSAIMAFSADRWGPASDFKAPRGRLPLLLVQSNRDQSNPPHAARVLWHIARPPKMYLHLEGASHGAPFMSASPWRPVVESVTTDFLRAWTAPGIVRRSAELKAARRDGAHPGLSFLTGQR